MNSLPEPRLEPLSSLRPEQLETPAVLKATIAATRRLAELKGTAATIPNQAILIGTLWLQEAKDSSAVENIVTTQDDLFRGADDDAATVLPAVKEVRNYVAALRAGYELVRDTGLLTNNHILAIQVELERNSGGFRRVPGTMLRDSAGRVVYVPPQDARRVVELMDEFQRFVNDDSLLPVDPLLKMALLHHRFESIHPFYDGNGRTGRILNVLYLMRRQLLDVPVLYLSRHIVRTRADYYRLLQHVRDTGEWSEWLLYMLRAVETTAAETCATIEGIRTALLDYKHRIRAGHRFYSQDLVNNLFSHPYTRIEFVMRDLRVSRLTATRYLDRLAEDGLLEKRRVGRASYYVNRALVEVLARADAAA
jgi:Fic family protein